MGGPLFLCIQGIDYIQAAIITAIYPGPYYMALYSPIIQPYYIALIILALI